jgi:GNAT superfamily N-acetyltransferase
MAAGAASVWICVRSGMGAEPKLFPLTVRIAQPEDARLVADLMSAFRNHIGRDWPADDQVRATVEALLEDPNTEFLLAGSEGVCQLRYRLSVWTATEDCWLEDLYVTEEARGKGLGRALIEAAFERARARGCKRIQLDVADDNARALDVYRAAGFGLDGSTRLITRRL